MSTTTLIQEPRENKQTRTKTPSQIDQQIIDEVNRLTSEDSTIWTCPDFNRREYAHSFFQYPAMMIPLVQKNLIEIVVKAHGNINNMLDPFMGSATTLVACMESGLNCFGQDINPLAVLIAKVRTGPFYFESIENKSQELIERIERDKSRKIEPNFDGINKWFKSNVKFELSKIVRAIRCENRLAVRRFFWVILAETIRLTSNDRTSTFKLHSRPQQEIDHRDVSPIEFFLNHLEKSIEDYKLHANLLKEHDQLVNGSYKNRVEVRLLNSKDGVYTPDGAAFFDLMVTSPPYGDNRTTVTYGQHSYLPLQWIDLDDIDNRATKDFLKSTSEIDTRSLGGQLSKFQTEAISSIEKMSPSLRDVLNVLRKIAPKKVKKVAAFISDLNFTIDTILKAMKPNSYLIWTVGNRRVHNIEIPNDRILTELLLSKGCTLIKQIEREIINKRMALRNSETSLMNSEDILIFRKLGKK